ncbi:hypothetical protein [Roseiconus lacunae]|uniref:BON domain-containing protein n=1 Tax=Roseiconus lacunae TaxID=2605694 RepID=A0ABT7PQ62_9BACT|nr:hypothetical protein [Roseiconus lacunae]MDM4018632.1 hypothetical protein [Roseiconus lacunae]WRQ51400.1 hypothetical protein U8335_02430 [Stieleria sp. HD01]
MATTITRDGRSAQTIHRIDSVLSNHRELAEFRMELDITMEGSRIVLRGQLPTVALKQALVPAIRQAGVLGQVCNCVEVS